MVRKGDDFAFFIGRTDESNLNFDDGALWILTPEERSALLREIREKIDLLEESELRNLYILLKHFEIIDK